MSEQLRFHATSAQSSKVNAPQKDAEQQTTEASYRGGSVTPAHQRKKMLSESSDTDCLTPKATERDVFVLPASTSVRGELKPNDKTIGTVKQTDAGRPASQEPPAMAQQVFNFPNSMVVEVLQTAAIPEGIQIGNELAQKYEGFSRQVSKFPANAFAKESEATAYKTRTEASISSVARFYSSDEPEDTAHAETNTSSMNHAEKVMRSHQDRVSLIYLKSILANRSPAPPKINVSLRTDPLPVEKGAFFIPFDSDVVINGKDVTSSDPKYKDCSRSSSVCSLVPKQSQATSCRRDPSLHLEAVKNSDVVLQLQLSDTEFLPFYSSRYHMTLESEEKIDEYQAASCIRAYVEKFAPGASVVIDTLATDDAFDELVDNLKTVYQIQPDTSGHKGTGSEIKITLINSDKIRIDARVGFDRYCIAGNDEVHKGFIQLRRSLEISKIRGVWVPGWCNCVYDITTNRSSYRKQRRASGLSPGSSSSHSSKSSLSSAKSRSLGKSLDTLSRSSTALHRIVVTPDPACSSKAPPRRSVSMEKDTHLTVVPLHSRGGSEDLSAEGFTEGLLAPHSTVSSKSSVLSSPESGSSSGLSLQPLALSCEVSSDSSELDTTVIRYKGGWCHTNVSPTEALYRMHVASEIASWSEVTHKLSESADMAKQLRQMNTKMPFPHHYGKMQEKSLGGVENISERTSLKEEAISSEVQKEMQAKFETAWYKSLEELERKVTAYRCEMDMQKPPMKGLSPDQANAVEDFFTEVRKTRNEFMESSAKLDHLLKGGSHSFGVYREKISELAALKVQLNQLNKRNRADQTQRGKTFFQKLEAKVGVSPKSALGRYMELRKQEFYSIGLLCAVKLDLAISRLSINAQLGTETETQDCVREAVSNGSHLNMEGMQYALETVWGSYLERDLECRFDEKVADLAGTMKRKGGQYKQMFSSHGRVT
ncbi:hypothetical protein [Parendozoicomonas sp. Alg238-R29]|uniref:hypothetical protein n=1 Tax=Parendozoicomonas sp. Alg238-R29 TaxID=2993446 RepID=UPI00248E11DB|nr:hypothetical protein [Parendozoicomonas sp. Alg238-R29]